MQAVNGYGHPSTAPLAVPAGYVGPVVLPGTNRQVWWTGRIAIGLRYEWHANPVVSESASWVQRVLLAHRAKRAGPSGRPCARTGAGAGAAV